MDRLKTLYTADRKEWRSWLERNFDKEKEVWLLYPKKSSGKPRISYNDAVEEALCFGWIDSTVRSLDEESSIQRFTPRNPGSRYSQANKERLTGLLRKNLLHPSMIDTAIRISKEDFIFPADIVDALKSDKVVWEHYGKFSPSYKRIRVAYIEAARKRPEEFRKRLANFIAKTKENKRIGFGGIEKYY